MNSLPIALLFGGAFLVSLYAIFERPLGRLLRRIGFRPLRGSSPAARVSPLTGFNPSPENF